MEIRSAYSLMEIANWQLNSNNSDVQLPALQQNLVWKPEQIELLWDSIIRGFPIGSFVIEYRGSDNFLLDGQQRSNAISLGFDTSIIAGKDNMNAVLWLDIEPSNADSATKKFWIKVTTKPHPWGYKNNDESSVLSANEISRALSKFGLKNIYENTVSLRDTWPVEAGLPIPMSFILCNRIKNIHKEDFIDEVLSDINKLCERHTKYFECYKRKLKNDNIRVLIAKCYNDFSFIDKYRVGVNIFDSAVTI